MGLLFHGNCYVLSFLLYCFLFFNGSIFRSDRFLTSRFHHFRVEVELNQKNKISQTFLFNPSPLIGQEKLSPSPLWFWLDILDSAIQSGVATDESDQISWRILSDDSADPKNILLWWFWAKTLYISMEGRSGVGAVFWANTAQLAQNKKDGAKCEPWRYCLHDFMTEPVRYYLTLILKNVELRLYLREHLEPVL